MATATATANGTEAAAKAAAKLAEQEAAEAAAKLAAEQEAAKLASEAAAKLAAKLTAAPAVRPPTYRVVSSAPAFPFGKQTLTTGVSVKSGVPHYVLESGQTQVGFPIAAVALAIMEGMIDRDTVKALWLAADSR